MVTKTLDSQFLKTEKGHFSFTLLSTRGGRTTLLITTLRQPLEMVLRLITSEETFIQETLLKFGKNSENLWHLSKIFPHLQVSKMEIPLQTCAAQTMDVPFPELPVRGLFSQNRQDIGISQPASATCYEDAVLGKCG